MHTGSFSVEELAVIESQAMGRLFGHGIDREPSIAAHFIDAMPSPTSRRLSKTTEMSLMRFGTNI